VIVFAWVEQGYIHTESSFGSKSKAKDCPIIVVDENGRVIHKGRTDSKGNSVGSGIYFYNLVVDGKTIAGNKMVLLK